MRMCVCIHLCGHDLHAGLKVSEQVIALMEECQLSVDQGEHLNATTQLYSDFDTNNNNNIYSKYYNYY